MMSHQLSSWQAANNYRTEGDVVYGVYQGCGFAVSEEDGGKLFIFMLSAGDNAAFDDFENALASAGGQLADGQVGDVENYLAVFFDESSGNISNATMDQVLAFTASQARNCGFRVPNTCVKCGARATKRSFLNNMVQPLCADCSAQNKQSRRAAPVPPPVSPFATAPEPMVSQDDQYAKQYSPLVPDSSKYDDSYDEYAGMQPHYGDSNSYSDPYGGTYNDEASDGYGNYDNAPISFDDSGDDYRDIMGNENTPDFGAANDGGSVGMGLLGALLGAFIGVIPYILIALLADFHMAALCFPAGMLAVLFYTFLHGRRVKGMGMGVSIGVSVVVSFATMFLAMVFSYVNDTRTFGQALSYVFSEQLTFFLINSVFSILGSVFGAFFMINKMDDYCRD